MISDAGTRPVDLKKKTKKKRSGGGEEKCGESDSENIAGYECISPSCGAPAVQTELSLLGHSDPDSWQPARMHYTGTSNATLREPQLIKINLAASCCYYYYYY